MLYTKLKIDQHGELSQRPQGYVIYDDDDDDDDDELNLKILLNM